VSPHRPRIAIAMIKELLPYAFTDADLDRLRSVGDLLDPTPLDDFSSVRAQRVLADCDVLVGHWGCPPLDEVALSHAPRLRLLAYAGGTVKWIVSPALWRHGVTVTSAAVANAEPVAEYTLAVILLANKAAFVSREWLRDPGVRVERPQPVGNWDKQVGIIGASHVGRAVIRLLRPFRLTAVVHDPYLGAEDAAALGVRSVGLDELLSTSDVVSIHAPDVPATRGMIGAAQLALLRDGATLVNTARGALVDTDALEAALASGRISAVLDVTEPEPLPRSSPLLGMPNVFLTPHLAGSQGSELARLAEVALDEVERYARGLPPAWPVREADLDRIA
jgi:phosphoglycerate dehydrogenase-like enzyme